jgi:hypothetical protein
LDDIAAIGVTTSEWTIPDIQARAANEFPMNLEFKPVKEGNAVAGWVKALKGIWRVSCP